MKKWALVLSGGGGRGIAYIGVFKALEKLDLRPDMIAGTSIGAVLGALYCSGMKTSEIEDFIVNEFDLKDYLEGISFKFGDGAFFRFLQAQEALTNLATSRGVDSGKKILEILRKLTSGKFFSEASPAFACNAADLLTGKEVVLDSGPIAEAVRASMAVPGIFTPVETGDKLLADGGILENLPVWIPRTHGISTVIAVNCSPFTKLESKDITTGISVFFRALSVAGNDRPQTRKLDIPDLEIKLSPLGSEFDFSHNKELIASGEESILAAEKSIRRILSHRGFGLSFLLKPFR